MNYCLWLDNRRVGLGPSGCPCFSDQTHDTAVVGQGKRLGSIAGSTPLLRRLCIHGHMVGWLPSGHATVFVEKLAFFSLADGAGVLGEDQPLGRALHNLNIQPPTTPPVRAHATIHGEVTAGRKSILSDDLLTAVTKLKDFGVKGAK